MGSIIILIACLFVLIVLVAIAVIKAVFNLLAWIGEKISERGLGVLVVLIFDTGDILYILNEFVSGRLIKSILLCALL